MIKQRNIGICILLSIVTCGIYGLYWFVVLTDDICPLWERLQKGTVVFNSSLSENLLLFTSRLSAKKGFFTS